MITSMEKEGEPDRLYRERCEKLHEVALAKGEKYYLDPRTGYQVSTRIALEDNGKCCESGCRHCPYGFRDRV